MPNPIITEADFRRQLNSIAGRAFLFYGEEDYLKSVAVRLARETLCPDPSFAIFNDVTIDGLDYTPEKLLDAMMPPPMMTEARLILLRGFDSTAFRDGLDDLLEVLSQLADYDYNTVIIHVAADLIDTGTPKKPSAILKKLAEAVTPVYFPAQTDARLAVWAGKHFQHLGVEAAPALCTALIAHAGRSMFVLANEIEKLAAYVKSKGRSTLEAADIHTVAAPNAEIDTFDLTNAILDGKSAQALEVLSVMQFERRPPAVILNEIAGVFSDIYRVKLLLAAGKTKQDIISITKLHQFKVGLLMQSAGRTGEARLLHAIELTAKADAAIKSSYNDYAPIERLICAL